MLPQARIDDEILKAFQRGTYNHVEREIDACTKVRVCTVYAMW